MRLLEEGWKNPAESKCDNVGLVDSSISVPYRTYRDHCYYTSPNAKPKIQHQYQCARGIICVVNIPSVWLDLTLVRNATAETSRT